MATTTTKRPQQAAVGADSGASKECCGVQRMGIERHAAPRTEFGKAAVNPDGLDRYCRTCWRSYLQDLAARKAAGTFSRQRTPPTAFVKGLQLDPTSTTAPLVQRTITVAGQPIMTVAAPVDGDAAAQRRQRTLERQLDRVGVETDAGQQLLAQAAAEAAEARRAAWREAKRQQRAAARARAEAVQP